MKKQSYALIIFLLLSLFFSAKAEQFIAIPDGYSEYYVVQPNESGFTVAQEVLDFLPQTITTLFSQNLSWELYDVESYRLYDAYTVWLMNSGYERVFSYATMYMYGHFHVFAKGQQTLLLKFDYKYRPYKLLLVDISKIPSNAYEAMIHPSLQDAEESNDYDLMHYASTNLLNQQTSEYGYSRLMNQFAPFTSMEMTLKDVYFSIGAYIPEHPLSSILFEDPFKFIHHPEMAILTNQGQMDKYIEKLHSLGFQSHFNVTLKQPGEPQTVFELYGREPEHGRMLLAYTLGQQDNLGITLLMTDLSEVPPYVFEPLYAVMGTKNFTFEYRINGFGHAVITKYKLGGYAQYQDLVVPSILDGHPVIGIDDYAFLDAPHLRTLQIGWNIEEIQPYAFEGIDKTVILTPRNSSAAYRIEEDGRIRWDTYESEETDNIEPIAPNKIFTNGNYRYEILPDGTARIIEYKDDGTEELAIPAFLDGIPVTVIGASAFSRASAIRITVPEGVERIEKSAFLACFKLLGIKLSSSLRIIDNRAFSFCSNLGIQLPPNLEYIGAFAFQNCQALKGIILPDSLRFLGFNSFERTPIQSLELPKNLKDLGGHPFGDWYESQSRIQLTIHPDNHHLAIRSGALIQVDKGKLIFLMDPLDLTEYTIPERTKLIAPNAFPMFGDYSSKFKLMKITYPDSLTDIPAWPVAGGLTEANLPPNLEFLGEWPFGLLPQINELVFPDNPLYIARVYQEGWSIAKKIKINPDSPNYQMLLALGCENLIETEHD